ncbi:Lysophospholipase L2 [Aeromonas diversa CDC 2478-85]|uniref:Lysophospholipase L2 n=1 Tax=Aeromonas diversa CDC 2478-85 TaxID=1268237 RepID=N9VIU3_9GAMM|nr:alpha/beta fold hydrolase [Aeromonas diversa]ENY71306.1 Lysophospholipase L2 [Aeromonas diversa CDC 2478-85]
MKPCWLLLLTLLTPGVFAVTAPLSSETRLELLHRDVLPTFWQEHAREGEFIGKDKVPIRYAVLRHPGSERAIMVVNGRVETYLKYQELAWDLWNQGYSLYLIDHRGQGRSGRMLGAPQKGYVAHFEDYVEDLKTFHDRVVQADQPAKVFILAHSMGGAISARYLERWPDDVQAAVLSSPMMGINLGGLPVWLAKGLASTIDTVGGWFGEPPYGPGQGPYTDHGFTDNELTHSALRYRLFREQYERTPEVKLGGATAHWIREGILAGEQAIAEADKIKTPLLLLQAGEDSVVDNAAQETFCHTAPCEGGKPLRIEGAWHELFIERDELRQSALQATLTFLGRY